MCGRYVSRRSREELVEAFGVERVEAAEPLPPDYNVAPTKPVYAVLERLATGAAAPARELRVVRWGLVPSWAKDRSIASRMINARAETVTGKPAFRRAFTARRCLVPADGYYEWAAAAGAAPAGRGRGRSQPFFIHPRDGGVLAFAGLYEVWQDRSRDPDDPDARLWTCTVLTTAAQGDLRRIHDRMPLVVPPERYGAWLDPGLTDPEELRGLLAPPPPDRLVAVPVSTAVNSVRNNGPHLIEPLPPGLPGS